MDHGVTVRGRLVASNRIQSHDLEVELVERGRRLKRTAVQPDGSFQFMNILTGIYTVRVLTRHSGVLLTDFLTVGPHLGDIELRLPEFERARPVSGTVSLRSLKPLPRDVQKELLRAQEAAKSEDRQQAVDRLQRALVACPDCIQVHTNLGAHYMRSGAFDQAAAAFRRAVELDPDAVLAQNNLAIALVTLKDYNGSEAAARKALRLDPAAVPARYALGLVALGRNECTTEALEHLKAAAEVFSQAHLSATQLLVCRGEIPGAIKQLEAYLKRPDPQHRQHAESWLAALRAQSE